MEESVRFLETILVGPPFFAIFMAGNSAGRGSGHTLVPTVIGMVRLWLIRVAGSYLLAIQLGMGSLGVWLAIMASNIIGGGLMLAWIARGDWARPVVNKCGERLRRALGRYGNLNPLLKYFGKLSAAVSSTYLVDAAILSASSSASSDTSMSRAPSTAVFPT